MTTGATIHTTEGLKMTVTRRTKPPVIPNLEMKVISDSPENMSTTTSMPVSAASIASGEDQQGQVSATRIWVMTASALPRHTDWVCSFSLGLPEIEIATVPSAYNIRFIFYLKICHIRYWCLLIFFFHLSWLTCCGSGYNTFPSFLLVLRSGKGIAE